MENLEKRYVILIGEMKMPDQNAAAQRTVALCHSLIDIGKTPVVIGLKDGDYCSDKIMENHETFSYADSYYVKNPVTIIERIKRTINVSKFIEIIDLYGTENISAVIAQEHESVSLLRLITYCKKKKIRLIVDTFEWYEKSKLKFPIGMFKDIDTCLRMRWLYPHIRYMICISGYLYKHYVAGKACITRIPGTIVRNDTAYQSACRSYEKNAVATFVYAGYPGETCQKDKLDWVIRCICELNDEGKRCRLRLIGDRLKETMESYIPDLVDYRYYKDAVQYLGELPHKVCLEVIGKADFSIIARENKRLTQAGFPTKLSESLGCGTPVIITPAGDMPDYITDGINGIVADFCDDSSLKTAIRRAIHWFDTADMKTIHRLSAENNPLVSDCFNDNMQEILS
ncbi:MAG: glycosyltransferase family 4 protein [Clostridia bacterium]